MGFIEAYAVGIIMLSIVCMMCVVAAIWERAAKSRAKKRAAIARKKRAITKSPFIIFNIEK